MNLEQVKEKLVEINEQQNSVIQNLLHQKKLANNIFYRCTPLANFKGTPEDAAAILVMNFEGEAYNVAANLADTSKGSEELQAYQYLMDTVESLQPDPAPSVVAKVYLDTQGNDDLDASPPDEEEPDTQAEKEAKGTQESFSLNITLNEKQLVAKDFAFQGKSFCLIGAAGTGKTTAQRAVASSLLEQGRLSTTTFKLAGGSRVDAPSFAAVAYTRRAASNLRKAIHKDPVLAKELAHNVMTIHALLEYQPETYWDSVEAKTKFRFAPMRNAKNPLDITHLVIEEASMLGLDLWANLFEALPEGVQIIFIGDINQLPPVFGPSILNYALIQLPVVELTHVYRNQGIVLENAHNILSGKKLIENEHFSIIRGNKPQQLGQETLSHVLHGMFEKLSERIGDDGLPEYDVENDIILSPFNKQHLGTDNMNKWIAQFVGAKRGAVVHEIIAGFNKLYLAVGDKVMFNKRDGVIKEIKKNFSYHGKEPQLPGADLSRFGVRIMGKDSGLDFDEVVNDGALDYSNFSLEALEEEKAERKMQASHEVVIDYGDNFTDSITAAGDFAPQVFSLGYCLTVHKAQGSEWRKVFILMHKDHSVMLFRELFYTAVTRARTKVAIISKDYVIEKAIAMQRIKGNTLKDKLAFFNSGINDTVNVSCTK